MGCKNANVLALALLVLAACTQDEPASPEGIRFPSGEPFSRLSEYGLYDGPLDALQPVEGLIPYDLNTPLFTDYADKFRLVYVPSGQAIPYDTVGTLSLPIGSVLVKNFSYTIPSGERRLIETRLLLHYPDGWVAETYLWRDDQTEADRLIAGTFLPVEFRAADGSIGSTLYQVPNKNQCKSCHATGNTLVPIGPKVANLNREYPFAEGTANQLDYWYAKGILEQPSAQLPQWPDWTDELLSLNDRARAYLDVNCAHCHNGMGSANNSGLDLSYANRDSLSLGFYKAPVAAGEGSGGLDYDIVPGDADASILVFRMENNDANIRMPELGRSVMHDEGVALIRAWIDAL